MRSIILSHKTALAIWSNSKASLDIASQSVCNSSEVLHNTQGVINRSDIDNILKLSWTIHLPSPLDVIVDTPQSRRTLAGVRCHKQIIGLPNGSLVPVGKSEDDIQIYVTSPELTFIHMANILCIPELIELGFELCGHYAIAPLSEYGFIGRSPVSNIDKIRSFLDNASGMHGIKPARIAAKWVVDNSRSPKETNICQFLHMPRRLGGRGMRAPQLNRKIELPADFARMLNARVCIPDMVWEDAKVILEYDSKSWHGAEERLERDAIKRNLYRRLGYECITMTRTQLYDFRFFVNILEELDRQLRVKSGKRPALPHTQRQYEMQRELHDYLLHGKRSERFADPTTKNSIE